VGFGGERAGCGGVATVESSRMLAELESKTGEDKKRDGVHTDHV